MWSMKNLLNLVFVIICIFVNGVYSIDYTDALTKSLMYYEAQRSGVLPQNQRAAWRADSALNDGKDAGVDLTGGYYDAGDNVKFGFPLAYAITMLSWSVLEFKEQLRNKNELDNAYDAIKWGTDYLIKAHPQPNVLYAQVGDGDSDHSCWERPEDMTTPRTVFKIDEEHPGSDLAGETAAAFAAASIALREKDASYSATLVAFKTLDPNYSATLLTHARQLFDFANNHRGIYSQSIPAAAEFYSSSNYNDELLWAASWLYKATGEGNYRQFIENSPAGGVRSMFSWDDKYVGAQILIARLVLDGRAPSSGVWEQHKDQAEQFLCNCMQKGNNNIVKTNGGLLWFAEWDNLQYTTSAAFALTVYADYLQSTAKALKCASSLANPADLTAFARSQADYILGANSRSMSYMVGYGPNYPQKVHHRGASIVSIKKDPAVVGCKEGFTNWFNKDQPNPNVVVGAVVGGPDRNDNYDDNRQDYKMAEVGMANSPGLVGVLAKLA